MENKSELTIDVDIDVERNTNLWDVVKRHYGATALSILEIGVFRAKQIQAAYERCNILSYTGVDPYLGDASDPYTGSYWKDQRGASSVYQLASDVFAKMGGVLHRCTSDMYYGNLEGNEQWDVIFVDGNHKYRPALSDMCHWFRKVRVGGCMIMDDYANPDTPEVTPAVNRFLEAYSDAVGYVETSEWWFKNHGKHIPICTKRVYVYKIKECNFDYRFYIGGINAASEKFFGKWGNEIRLQGFYDPQEDVGAKWNGLERVNLETISKNHGVLLIPNNAYGTMAQILFSNGYREGIFGRGFIRQEVFEIAYSDSWLL